MFVFMAAELGSWLGDLFDPDTRLRMLEIRELSLTAQGVISKRLQHVRSLSDATISHCTVCEQEAMVRLHPRSGSACFYCGCPPESPP